MCGSHRCCGGGCCGGHGGGCCGGQVHHGHHHFGWHTEHGRCCSGGFSPHGFHRPYWTKEAEVRSLERYLEDLEAEATGIRERLKDLKGALEEPPK